MSQTERKPNLIDIEQGEYELQPDPAEAMPMLGQDEHAPTWFARAYQGADTSDLALRYRQRLETQQQELAAMTAAQERYRRHMEERFQTAKRMAERDRELSASGQPGHELPPARKPIASKVADEGGFRYAHWEDNTRPKAEKPAPRQAAPQQAMPQAVRTQAARPQARKPGRSRSKIVAGIAFACLLGGSVGFLSAHPALFNETYARIADGAKSGFDALTAVPQVAMTDVDEKVAVPETVLTKKPVKAPRLQVADVSGALNDPIPLGLTAIPASPDEPIALKITGLPERAYLTQGTEVAKGQWLVKPQQIQSVQIVVPQSATPEIDLSVAPVAEKTGEPAAPAQSMTVALDKGDLTVVPVSAAPEGTVQAQIPEAIPVPKSLEINEAQGLMGKGDALLKTGDLVSARQFYLRAHGQGLAEAAYGIGQTYDPLVYKALNVRGLEPDKAKAEEWYGRAAQAGSAAATAALAKLAAQTP